ncbi:ExeM/NucH family extracellular endonuclease [Ornatilinea apprima]|uniref:ExeM/NucH family extracellular endonuclease n=1 Tax=Ornatilinea apprima TaxID=1134406 RepID=UPI0009465EA6|nr:ExeM/NucH family extracellular endonuclease [Ornatilinea apprima]
MFRQPSSRLPKSIHLFLVIMMALLPLHFGTRSVQAAPSELFFSEYIEGSSNNKALEIFNGTGADVDLTAGAYNVQMYFNGNSSAGLTLNLNGVVADGDVFVLAHSSAAPEILAQADFTNGSGWFNGDDAVVLRKGTDIIDVIGQIGFDPGSQWGSDLTSTADNTLRRKGPIEMGDPNGSDVFDPSVEWDGYDNNTFDGLGSHSVISEELAPIVASTDPADGATGVAVDANLQVVFSEAVDVSGAWFDLTCSVSGAHTAVVSGGPASYVLDPDVNFTNEDCTLTIFATNVTDQDTDDPPDQMESDTTITFSPVDVCLLPYDEISVIQGSGPTPAVTGPVTTMGVVIADYEGPSPNLRGFYLQDLEGDGDPATSDGIFVFNGNNDHVSLGDVVRVSGSAADYQGQTQISSVSSIVKCGEGAVAPVEVSLPVPTAEFLEQYEGMLVTLPQTLYVTEHYQLGRFGQVVLSSGDRLWQPTSLALPGAEALALQAANNLNRIILDDVLNNQNPDPILFGRGGLPLSADNTLRGGDTVTGVTGVMTYTWSGNSASGNAYRVRPVSVEASMLNFVPANPRPETPAEPGGTLKVSALNLLNYFNTFDGLPDTVDNCANGVGGEPTDCRGADTANEFERQAAKTIEAILTMNVDVLGVVEVENDGYGPDSAIQDLVDRLNAASAPGTYAFIDVDAATEQINALGTDAIKVGLVYKPLSVTPVGSTAVLNTGAFGEYIITDGVTSRNRPALAQTFQQNSNGARFTAVVNHLKSKGSACDDNISPVGPDPDLGDGQGNCNLTRKAAAEELAAWLAGDPTNTSETDILILGDLNSYSKEDPIAALESAGYTNLIHAYGGDTAYSYVFDGQWGYLDHALGSDTLLSQVTGVEEYHINADEPSVLDYNTDFKSPDQIVSLFNPDQYRVSDHDPVIVGLDLQNAPDLSDLGFVTGGGWFVSPAGAYTAQPELVAKTHFDLTVKYHYQNILPQGNFKLKLQKARFDFRSDTLDWLTINGDHSLAIFTGSGSLNDEGGYHYMVWVGDGSPEAIRVLIWNNDQIVFDNRGLQPINNGSLVIH